MWLRVVGRPGAREFAVLSAIEAFSRALIAGVIPLEAHALLVEAQTISLVYAGVGMVAFATSFMVPLVLLRIRRKWIFSAGTLCMVAAPLLMLVSQALPFVTALQVRSLAVVCVNIALNLYILDYIRRKDFVASEPLRLAFLGISWFIGPALGIFLYSRFGLLPVSRRERRAVAGGDGEVEGIAPAKAQLDDAGQPGRLAKPLVVDRQCGEFVAHGLGISLQRLLPARLLEIADAGLESQRAPQLDGHPGAGRQGSVAARPVLRGGRGGFVREQRDDERRIQIEHQ